MDKSFGKGIIFASLSFIMWGIFPLYWKFLIAVDSLHILAFRILLSLVLVGAILLANKNTAWLAVFKEPKKTAVLIPTALLICCNWGLYIWAVNRGHTIDASLGYYINPLVSILLGLIFFRERLKPLQWVAAAIALAGVLIVTLASGALPWVSLGLALTFGFYGLLKKKLELSALESLGAETLASAPIGIFLLFFSFGSASFSGLQGLGYLSALSPQTLTLLALCGLVTVLPLYFFALGAKMLPLSTLGFTQFINPTLQFALGLFVFKEAFPIHHFVAFIFIWTAVIVYLVSLKIGTGDRGLGTGEE
jgi:chloramphenicol-sensitive protein RarD